MLPTGEVLAGLPENGEVREGEVETREVMGQIGRCLESSKKYKEPPYVGVEVKNLKGGGRKGLGVLCPLRVRLYLRESRHI